MRAACIAVFLVSALGASVAVPGDANFRQCDNTVAPLEACSITALRIDPCASSSLCRLKKGNTAALSLDFTPHFSADASQLKTAVYYPSENKELIFETVGIADACPHASCPFVDGTPNTFNFDLYIGKKLPKGKFTLRWKIWNEDDKTKMCCFETNVKLA